MGISDRATDHYRDLVQEGTGWSRRRVLVQGDIFDGQSYVSQGVSGRIACSGDAVLFEVIIEDPDLKLQDDLTRALGEMIRSVARAARRDTDR